MSVASSTELAFMTMAKVLYPSNRDTDALNIVTTHIPHNRIVLQEVTREYLFNLRIITYGL